MKFRNPWIDPRVVEVRPEAALEYLLAQGWKPIGPATNPLLLRFESPGQGEEAPILLVPRERDAGPMLQRMIDLVADLAHFEGRWAVDVLNDILQQPAGQADGNGLNPVAKAEHASK